MHSFMHVAQRLYPLIRTWGPPLIGVLYFIYWSGAEGGRFLAVVAILVLFTLAIALAGRVPLASLALVTVVPILQLLGVLYPPSANSWGMFAAVGIVGFIVAFSARGWAYRLALPVGVVVSVLFAVRLIVPSFDEGSWTDWIGGAYAPRIAPLYPVREDFITLLVGALVFYVACWAFGIAARSLLRVRAIGGVLVAAENRLEETDFELRLSQDRARISRDVHDALAHSLAVIVSQAEGALALQSKRPKAAGEALGNIASVGRAALVEVRSLVEQIHDEQLAASRPTIDDLDEIVAHLCDVGMDVTLRTLGEPRPLAASHNLAVFRIVQESLTNALKHGGPTGSARVTLDWQGPGLAVLVASHAGKGAAGPAAPGRGIGIEGMKERAYLAGGWLMAEPSDDGSFIVTAFIPVQQSPVGEPVDA